MEDKKVAILYKEIIEAIKVLPLELQAKIYNAIFEYQFTGEITETDLFVKSFIMSHKTNFENMKARREASAENGKKGGAPKGNQNAKKETTENNLEQPKNNLNQPRTTYKQTENNLKQETRNKKQEYIYNNIKNIQAETALPDLLPEKTLAKPKQNTPKSPQSAVFEYFSQKYRKHTGIEYLAEKKDFVNLSKLIAKYGIDLVKQKIDWLEIGCLNAVFWFTQDINDFTIGKLQSQWNYILPKLTPEQKKQKKEQEEAEQMKQRVMDSIAKRNQLKLGGQNVRTN